MFESEPTITAITKTVAEWGKAKDVEGHLAAAVAAYLRADEHLQVTEVDFDTALHAFRTATYSV